MNIPETIVRSLLLAAENSLAEDDIAHADAVRARTAIDSLVVSLTNARSTKATYVANLRTLLRQHPNTAATPLPPAMPKKPPPLPPGTRPRESYSPPSPRKKR